ncbi:grpE protein homolog 1, mitochondrial isoform X2 [Eutrema salsugineum]|uniref:grpE protein homolog 1, mitochondrial isoform X2 n=1 Tax=Eutrema salsugineum TaxID=72664 RepID=UPI000CED4B0D|nr:grpE protein homolog 1, mitochondrial isoform X2 [Eutrema salsugineum]
MLVSRVLSRVSRSVGLRSSLSAVATPTRNQIIPIVSGRFHSLVHETPNKLVAAPVSLLNHATPDLNVLQRFSFFSSSSAESKENESNTEVPKTNEASEDKEAGKATDSETDFEDLSREDLVKLVAEKEDLVKVQQEDIKEMKDKVLRTYAEMENLMDRTKRNAENAKKFAIQNFATSLLDVADNLGRASSVVKESFSKIDTSKDSAGAAPLLKTLLEGVEMTEKQLAEVFKKSGLVKEDPLNEPFDPNRHNAVFQVPDASKPEGTIAHVLKSGYTLFDRVIRPAEVGVTCAVENQEGEKESEA